jgi:hypothetical protein
MKMTIDVRYVAVLVAMGCLVYFSGMWNLSGSPGGKAAVRLQPWFDRFP